MEGILALIAAIIAAILVIIVIVSGVQGTNEFRQQCMDSGGVPMSIEHNLVCVKRIEVIEPSS